MSKNEIERIKKNLQVDTKSIFEYFEKFQFDGASKEGIESLIAHTEAAISLMCARDAQDTYKANVLTDLFNNLQKSSRALRNIEINTSEIDPQTKNRLENCIKNLNFLAVSFNKVTENGLDISGKTNAEVVKNTQRCVKYIGDPNIDIEVKRLILNMNHDAKYKVEDIFLLNPQQFMIEVPKSLSNSSKTKKIPFFEWIYEVEYLNGKEDEIVANTMKKFEEFTMNSPDFNVAQKNYDMYIKFICEKGIKIKAQNINPILLTDISIPLLVKYKILNDDQLMGMVNYNVLSQSALLAPYKDGATIFEAYCSRIKEDKGREVVDAQIKNAIQSLDSAESDKESETIKEQILSLVETGLKYDLVSHAGMGALFIKEIITLQRFEKWATSGILTYEVLKNITFGDSELTLAEVLMARGIEVEGKRFADWMDEKFYDQLKPSMRYRGDNINILFNKYKNSGLEEDFSTLITAVKEGVEKDIKEGRTEGSVINSIPSEDFALFRRIISEGINAKNFSIVADKLDLGKLSTILTGPIPINGQHPILALQDSSITMFLDYQSAQLITECMMHNVNQDGKPIPDGMSAEGGTITLFEYVYNHDIKISYSESLDDSKQPVKEDVLKVMIDSTALLINDIKDDLSKTTDRKERQDLQEERDVYLQRLSKISEIESITNNYLIEILNSQNLEAISHILVSRIEHNAAQVDAIFVELMSAYSKASKAEKNNIKQAHKACSSAIIQEGAEIDRKGSEIFLEFLEYLSANPKVTRYLAKKAFEQALNPVPSAPSPKPGFAINLDAKEEEQKQKLSVNPLPHEINEAKAELQSKTPEAITTQTKAALFTLAEFDDLLDDLDKNVKEIDEIMDGKVPLQQQQKSEEKHKESKSSNKVLGSKKLHKLINVLGTIMYNLVHRNGPVAEEAAISMYRGADVLRAELEKEGLDKEAIKIVEKVIGQKAAILEELVAVAMLRNEKDRGIAIQEEAQQQR